MNIFQALRTARIIMVDADRELFVAWHGGHGIHAYNVHGKEVSFWNTGRWDVDNPDESTIRESMERHIETGDYP